MVPIRARKQFRSAAVRPPVICSSATLLVALWFDQISCPTLREGFEMEGDALFSKSNP